jgi:hypothetical protein
MVVILSASVSQPFFHEGTPKIFVFLPRNSYQENVSRPEKVMGGNLSVTTGEAAL